MLGEGERDSDRRPAAITERARSRVLGFGEVGDPCDWTFRVGESLLLLDAEAEVMRGVLEVDIFLGLLEADP